MSTAVNFFVGSRVLPIKMVKFDRTKSSNQILFVSMLQIWNLRYFIHFFIIKYVYLESIFFATNQDIVSSFSTFDYMFFIDCIASLTQ